MATQRIYYGSGVWIPENAKEDEYLQNRGIAQEGRSSDWLVLAGGVSCYKDKLVDTLGYLSKFYGRVFFVFGNKDFNLNGENYILYMESVRDALKEHKNVHILDNRVVEVDGFKIAGSSAWYYLEDNYSKAEWDTLSLDKANVHPMGYKDSNAHSNKDADFLGDLRGMDLDLLITYFPPCEGSKECANLRGVVISENIPWIAGIDSFYKGDMFPIRSYSVFQANMFSDSYDLPYLELSKTERKS